MAQPTPPSERQPAPSWMQRAASAAPERRARMLEHMARARSLPQRQPAIGPAKPEHGSSKDILGNAFGHAVLFGVVAILFQSRIPLYVGIFLYCTDSERIDAALAGIGIRFEPDAIGPDIIRNSVSLFGWFALLASLRASAPAWLTALMPPAEASWTFVAGLALALATIDTLATRAMQRAMPWFGVRIKADGLVCSTIKLVLALGALALFALLGSL